MIKTIGLFLISAAVTWLATPASLAIYVNGVGFGTPGRPWLFLLLVPLAGFVIGLWLIAIKQYKQFSKE